MLAALSGCTCGKAPAPVAGDGAAPSSVETAVSETKGGRLSAPIAGTHLSTGAVIVAGLSVPQKAIVVTRFEPDGKQAWSASALRDVAWASDAELRVFASGDDGTAWLAWRGLVHGKPARVLAEIGAADGKLRGDVLDVTGGLCATDVAVTWVAAGGKIVERRAATADAREAATVPGDADPILVCGKTKAFVLAAGEDSIDLLAPKMALVSSDAEHFEYTTGDTLAVVRKDEKGVLASREVHGSTASSWQPLAKRLASADDEVVAVDGDERGPMVVVTHEEGTGDCPLSIHVLDRERASSIARVECNVDAGPFWTGFPGGKPIVAWPERHKGATPIDALVHVRPGAAAQRIAVDADALADAGCTDTTCFAVALLKNGAARVLRYP